MKLEDLASLRHDYATPQEGVEPPDPRLVALLDSYEHHRTLADAVRTLVVDLRSAEDDSCTVCGADAHEQDCPVPAVLAALARLSGRPAGQRIVEEATAEAREFDGHRCPECGTLCACDYADEGGECEHAGVECRSDHPSSCDCEDCDDDRAAAAYMEQDSGPDDDCGEFPDTDGDALRSLYHDDTTTLLDEIDTTTLLDEILATACARRLRAMSRSSRPGVPRG